MICTSELCCHIIHCANTGELSDLEKQLNEGGLSAHELEKAKKRLEQEKEELTQSLEARIKYVQSYTYSLPHHCR